jgi:hypothetical protein
VGITKLVIGCICGRVSRRVSDGGGSVRDNELFAERLNI